MTRDELQKELRGMLGPRYWVLDALMPLIDEYADTEVLTALEGTDHETY